MEHIRPHPLEHLPLADLLHSDEHPYTVRHEELRQRLAHFLPEGQRQAERIECVIDELIEHRWITPLTLWRCSAADGWPAPVTVYRRGPDCPESPVSA